MGKLSAKQHRSQHTHLSHLEIDDNPLPNPEELEKYKALDPDIIQWIKTRADKEQDGRLTIMSSESKLRTDGARRRYKIDQLTLWFAFIIIIMGLGTTIYFVSIDKSIAGSVAGGATILAAAKAFLNFRKPPAQKLPTEQ